MKSFSLSLALLLLASTSTYALTNSTDLPTTGRSSQPVADSPIVTTADGGREEISLPDHKTAQLMLWAEEVGVVVTVRYESEGFPRSAGNYLVRREHIWTAVTFSSTSIRIPSYDQEVSFRQTVPLTGRKVVLSSYGRVHWQLCHSVGACALVPPTGCSLETSRPATAPTTREAAHQLLSSQSFLVTLAAVCLLVGSIILAQALYICHIRSRFNHMTKGLQDMGALYSVGRTAHSKSPSVDTLPPYMADPEKNINPKIQHHSSHQEESIYANIQSNASRPEEAQDNKKQKQDIPQQEEPVYLNTQENEGDHIYCNIQPITAHQKVHTAHQKITSDWETSSQDSCD